MPRINLLTTTALQCTTPMRCFGIQPRGNGKTTAFNALSNFQRDNLVRSVKPLNHSLTGRILKPKNCGKTTYVVDIETGQLCGPNSRDFEPLVPGGAINPIVIDRIKNGQASRIEIIKFTQTLMATKRI